MAMHSSTPARFHICSTRGAILGVSIAITITCLATTDCSSSGTTIGGQPLFDAGTEPSTDSSSADAAFDTNVPGATWTQLYTDFFGPKGSASCTASNTCHGDPSQSGANDSGFVCASQDGCYASLFTAKRPLVTEGGKPVPSDTRLWTVLRKASGGGSMPKASTFKFSNDDMARIGAWIVLGAQNK